MSSVSLGSSRTASSPAMNASFHAETALKRSFACTHIDLVGFFCARSMLRSFGASHAPKASWPAFAVASSTFIASARLLRSRIQANSAAANRSTGPGPSIPLRSFPLAGFPPAAMNFRAASSIASWISRFVGSSFTALA